MSHCCKHYLYLTSKSLTGYFESTIAFVRKQKVVKKPFGAVEGAV